MTDETPSEISAPSSEKLPDKHLNTIYKSSYFYGKKLCQLFMNYNVGGHGSYSIVNKSGPITVIHNIAKDQKLNFARAVLKQLTPDELAVVLKDA